jgi:hypothetical protein
MAENRHVINATLRNGFLIRSLLPRVKEFQVLQPKGASLKIAV